MRSYDGGSAACDQHRATGSSRRRRCIHGRYTTADERRLRVDLLGADGVVKLCCFKGWAFERNEVL